MNDIKPIIAVDLSDKGKGGGPYVSTRRVMSSSLKNKYDFKEIIYRTSLGSGISIKRIIDLRNQILAINPDIVHFTGLQLSGFHMAVACKLAGIKNTIVTVHGTSVNALFFDTIKRYITVLLLEPLTLLLTKKFYGVSEYVVSLKISKIFSYKCVGAIYNFPPKKLSEDVVPTLRKLLGIAQNDIVIVSVARITRDKGYDVLDEAILKFKVVENVKFVIVGDGDYLPAFRDKLASLIEQKQVFCLGYRDDIQQILRACDVFVLPTLHETLSIALLEASREGLALVASNTGGVPEIVETGYNGQLVTTGSPDEIYSALKSLISNPELRKKYGNNAINKVNDKFSAESIVAKIDAVYQDLLKS